jgi:RNA polymerase sigma-70 factor (ECF subfamily)
VSVDVDEDRAVIASVLAGDTAAFAVLVRRWQGPLVNMAWRYCRDRGRAEEMAQEAFLRAYRNLAQWRGESAFSTWLFALAANVYRTELRRIPATMLALPPKYRDAVLLFYFHEQDVPEAARTLRVPEGTLKARLFRGRELLRSKFSRPKRNSAPAAAAQFQAQQVKEAP